MDKPLQTHGLTEWAPPLAGRFVSYDERDREWMEPLGIGLRVPIVGLFDVENMMRIPPFYQFTNNSSSQAVTIDSLRKAMFEMGPPVKPQIIVGTKYMESQLKATAFPVSTSIHIVDMYCGVPCEFYPTQCEALHAALEHRENGKDVIYVVD